MWKKFASEKVAEKFWFIKKTSSVERISLAEKLESQNKTKNNIILVSSIFLQPFNDCSNFEYKSVNHPLSENANKWAFLNKLNKFFHISFDNLVIEAYSKPC